MEEGFSDVRASIFRIVNQPELPGQDSVIDTLYNFETGIQNNLALPAPFEAKTDEFMTNAMPTAIRMILSAKIDDEKSRNVRNNLQHNAKIV